MALADDLWHAALADAGYGHDKAVLIDLPRQPPGGPGEAWGCWLLPHAMAVWSPLFDLTDEELAYANSPGVGDRLRVVLYTDAPEPVVFGLARHEIEHIRQAEWALPAIELSHWTQHAMARTVPNLRGSASIYNLMPRETDANAAAREAIRDRFPEAEQEIADGLQAALVAESPRADPQTMTFRTVSFAALFTGPVEEQAAADGQEFDTFLANRAPAFVEHWQRLTSDTRLGQLKDQALQAAPDAARVDAAGDRPGDTWKRCRGLYERAYRRALALGGFDLG